MPSVSSPRLLLAGACGADGGAFRWHEPRRAANASTSAVYPTEVQHRRGLTVWQELRPQVWPEFARHCAKHERAQHAVRTFQ